MIFHALAPIQLGAQDGLPPLWYATVSCTITLEALSKMEAQHIAVSRKINLAFFQYCTTPLQPEVISRKTF